MVVASETAKNTYRITIENTVNAGDIEVTSGNTESTFSKGQSKS